MISSTSINQYKYIGDNTIKTNSVNTENVTQPINLYENSSDTFEYSTENFNVFDTENNAKELENELKSVQEEQGFIGKAWNGIKSIFGGGSSKVEKNIEKYKNGEITFEEAQESIKKYQDGQKMSVDVVGDIASGILAVGAFSLAIGSAVVTGGASLPIALGIATAAGAGSKIAIKASDSAVGGREYSLKDLGYDAATGAVNGLLAPVTNGIGASVTKTIGTKMGLTVVKEGTEEVIEQGVKQGIKSIITQQGVDVIGGTLKARAFATAAGMAVDGAIGGSADNMVRAALNGEDVFEAGVQGAVGGMIMAPVIGGGFKLAGKAGKALNNKITTSSVMPDGVNTKFAQGAEGDCALLSVLDGMMNSKDAQKKIKSAISSPVGSDFYNVKIGNKSVNVLKSSLADEASDSLSDSKAIRIFELAYKQLQGTDDALDGGFAEVIAKQFGLNPVHITSDSISDEVLDTIAKENRNTVLSLGAFVDGDGNIAETGSRHYFSIKNIDADTKTVKVTNPYDSSKVIELSYDDVKKLGISIDGGSLNETSLPNVTRTLDDGKFFGNTVNITRKQRSDAENAKIIELLKDVKSVKDSGYIDEADLSELMDALDSGVGDYSSIISEVQYQQIKNKAFTAVFNENTIQIGGRDIYLTESQKAAYEQILAKSASAPVSKGYCGQVIMSDSMFIEATAVNLGLDINGKTTNEIFGMLRDLVFDDVDILPNVQFGNKKAIIQEYFLRDSFSESIQKVKDMSGDKAVHEMNKALMQRFDTNDAFAKQWMDYCAGSDKFKQFSALADTYKQELRTTLSSMGISKSKIEELISANIENEDHIIFRALQRDAIVDVNTTIQNWSDISNNGFIYNLAKKLVDGDTSEDFMGMLLTREGTSKFHTIEYSLKHGKWDTDAPYLPKYAS